MCKSNSKLAAEVLQEQKGMQTLRCEWRSLTVPATSPPASPAFASSAVFSSAHFQSSSEPSIYSPSINMSVQYASYLLASSPPAQLFGFPPEMEPLPSSSPSSFLEYLSSLQRSESPVLTDFVSQMIETDTCNLRKNCPEAVAHTLEVQRKIKKSVRFADTVGHALTSTYEFCESSDEPPLVCKKLLSVLQRSKQSSVVECTPSLQLCFPQPAADYRVFQHCLEQGAVALENVRISDDKTVTGTVKVKNIAYHKDVFVRWTTDWWRTHHDTHARYVNRTLSTQSAFDTFSFNLGCPFSSSISELQFAIGFRCNNCEYWDNNAQRNYVIKNITDSPNRLKGPRDVYDFWEEPVNWSTFASWNDLVNCEPYW